MFECVAGLLSLPEGLRGPVERRALRRLDSSWQRLTMRGESSMVLSESRTYCQERRAEKAQEYWVWESFWMM